MPRSTASWCSRTAPSRDYLNGTLYSGPAIEGMVLPLKDVADPELVLFDEDAAEALGWFPAVPNLNEIRWAWVS